MEQRGFRLAIKKAIDRTVAATVLVAAAPAIAATAVAVRVVLGRPILFRQMRPGLKGKPFEIIKFRTMTSERRSNGQLLPDGRRLTQLGKFLRRTSLDELPQLWCVLKGDLSLVGPRPLLMEYLDRYTPEEMRRHDVMPGITGLAAVRGRNGLTWEEKFRLDVEYVDTWSLALDCRILVETARQVVLGANVETPTGEMMPNLRPWLGTTRTDA